MPRRFRAIAARRHVAPAAASVLRVVEEHALAARIGAAAHARQFAEDERVGGRFDDRDDETGERVAHGHERANERAVGTLLDASRAGAAAEHAIDLAESVEAHAIAERAAFGERAQRGAHASRVDERRGRAGRLLLGAAANAAGAFGVEHRGRLEPAHHRVEVAQRVEAANAELGVHEVEPEPLTDERRTATVRPSGAARRPGLAASEVEVNVSIVRGEGLTSISRRDSRSKNTQACTTWRLLIATT